MNDMLVDAFDDVMQAACTPAVVKGIETGGDHAALWQSIVESGFTDALVPEESGGAGLGLRDVLGILTSAGRHAVPLPFAQTVMARGWLARAGIELPEGSIALAPFGARRDGAGLSIWRVPYGMVADHVLAVVEQGALLLSAAGATREADGIHGSLTAGMHWDDVSTAVLIEDAIGVRELAAAACTALLAGAADAALAMTLRHAGERVQFGKPIGKFQAIQQELSVMAEQTYATRMAAEMVFFSEASVPEPLVAASAMQRAAAAANQISAIAHAVHGAIGVTQEYDLHLVTRRLQQWRSDAGSENYWAGVIGKAAIESSESALDFIRNRLFPAAA